MALLSIAIRITVAFVIFIICAFVVWQVNNYFIRKIDEKYPKKYPFKPFDKD